MNRSKTKHVFIGVTSVFGGRDYHNVMDTHSNPLLLGLDGIFLWGPLFKEDGMGLELPHECVEFRI